MGFTPRLAAPECVLLIINTTPFCEIAEWFLQNVFEIGADQEIMAGTADVY